jgi:tetratricopeptide (TPR) repeat protein
MKRNLLVILAAVTSLAVNFQGVPKTLASGTTLSTASTPIYLGQASVQNSPVTSDRAAAEPSQSSGLTVPLLLGLLALLAIGAGAWVLRSRSRPQIPKVEDPQTLVRDRGTIPVIPQQAGLVEEEIVPLQEIQNPSEAVAVAQDSSELQLTIETLQAAIESAQHKFQSLSNKLEQEIAHQIQVLPDSILSQPSSALLPTQQQALEKLETLQAVFLDLELSTEGYFKLGNAWFNAQQYEAAIANYDKAINLNPDAAFAWFNTACIYALQGDVVRSVRYLKQSIHLDPDCLKHAAKHPGFDSMRKDSRFNQLLKT